MQQGRLHRAGRVARRYKDILGLWIEQTEGAKFWLRVMNDLKGRGVTDILIDVVDGSKSFPEAINAALPQAVVQTCIVHLIRYSMDFAAWKDRTGIAQALKTVYRTVDANAGQVALDHFAEGPWGAKYPAIAQTWRRNWNLVIQSVHNIQSVHTYTYLCLRVPRLFKDPAIAVSTAASRASSTNSPACNRWYSTTGAVTPSTTSSVSTSP